MGTVEDVGVDSTFSFSNFSCKALDLHHGMLGLGASQGDFDLVLRGVGWNKVRRSTSAQQELFQHMATRDPWDSHYPASIQDILEGYEEEEVTLLMKKGETPGPKKKSRNRRHKKKKSNGRPRITYHEAEVVKMRVTESPKRPGRVLFNIIVRRALYEV